MFKGSCFLVFFFFFTALSIASDEFMEVKFDSYLVGNGDTAWYSINIDDSSVFLNVQGSTLRQFDLSSNKRVLGITELKKDSLGRKKTMYKRIDTTYLKYKHFIYSEFNRLESIETDVDLDGKIDIVNQFFYTEEGYLKYAQKKSKQDDILLETTSYAYNTKGKISSIVIDKNNDGKWDAAIYIERDRKGRVLKYSKDDNFDGEYDYVEKYRYNTREFNSKEKVVSCPLRRILDKNGDGEFEIIETYFFDKLKLTKKITDDYGYQLGSYDEVYQSYRMNAKRIMLESKLFVPIDGVISLPYSEASYNYDGDLERFNLSASRHFKRDYREKLNYYSPHKLEKINVAKEGYLVYDEIKTFDTLAWFQPSYKVLKVRPQLTKDVNGRVLGKRYFGRSISSDKNKMAIGASSSVHMYEKINGNWKADQLIFPKEIVEDSSYNLCKPQYCNESHCNYTQCGFGRSLSLSGDILIVGNPGYNHDQLNSKVGTVAIYKYEDNKWVLQKQLFPPEKNHHTKFGLSVSYSDGHLVVQGMESVYMYKYNARSQIWELISRFKTPSYATSKVVVTDDLLVLGGADYWRESGQVFIYRYSDKRNGWYLDTTLSNEHSKYFGREFDFDGDILCVADIVTRKGISTGVVYMYRYDGKYWIQEAVLTDEISKDIASFGYEIKIDENLVYVSALKYLKQDEHNQTGVVHVFTNQTGTWKLSKSITPNDWDVYRFGNVINISDFGEVFVSGKSPYAIYMYKGLID